MKRPRLGRALALACALIIGIPAIGGIAATVTGTFTTQTFGSWLSSLSASASLSSSDGVPIYQNGAMRKWLPFNYFLDHTASNVADAAAARTNLGAMSRNADNVSDASATRGNLSAMARDGSDATLPTAPNSLLGNTTAHLYFAKAYGPCASGVTSDMGSCINTAAAAASAAGGGKVIAPAGSYNSATAIALASNVHLEGAGAGPFGVCGTTLTWNGSVGGTMIQIGSAAITSPIVHPGVKHICLNGGGGQAAIGVEQWTTYNADVAFVNIGDISDKAWSIRTATGVAGSAAGNIGNAYYRVTINLCHTNDITATGIYVDAGTSAADTNQNTWYAPNITNQHGIGWDWGGADANWVMGGSVFPCNASDASTGAGMIFRGRAVSNAENARGIMLFGTTVGAGGVGGIVSEAGGAGLASATGNILFGRKLEDGEPTPTCAAQGSASSAPAFHWFSVDGNSNWCGTPNTLTKPAVIWNVEAHTANYTVTTADTGKVFTNASAGGGVTFTLPSATGSGNAYCFSRVTAQLITVQTAGSDVIRLGPGSTSTAGGSVHTGANSSGARLCIFDELSANWRAASVVGVWTPDSGPAVVSGLTSDNNGVLTDVPIGNYLVSTSDLTKTSDTTLATVPGLSLALTAGKTYSCFGHLRVSAGAAGGVKVRIATSDTLTGTFTAFNGANYNGTTINARTSAANLTTNIGAATAVSTDIDLSGSIVVNAAGTIVVQAAQNASDAATTTIGQGSTFACLRVN